MQKKNIKKFAIALSAIIAGLYLTYLTYSHHQKQHHLTLYGNVDIKEVSASFRVSGRLKELLFDEGDFVKEGQLMASLDQETFNNDLELAKASLNAAKSNMSNAEEKFKRTQKLFKNDSASKQEYDNDKFAFEQLKSEVEVQKARVKIALTALNDTKLYAPSNAYIMTRVFEKGSMLNLGQTVYELSLTDQSFVRAYIDEEYLGKITNGMLVKIRSDSGNEYQGQIGFISSKAEFTPKTVETENLRTDLVYRLRITVKNPDNKLKQGMPVTVLVDF